MVRRIFPIALILLFLLVLALVLRMGVRQKKDESRTVYTDATIFTEMQVHFEGTFPITVTKSIEAQAIARRDAMRQLIVSDPRRALEESISWSDYQRLPDALRPYFELPFNQTATLRVLPVCGQHPIGTPDEVRSLEMNDQSWEAHVFGRREGQMTKENTALAGITLDGVAALREFPFEPLSEADAKTLAHLPPGNTSPAHDFSTGDELPAVNLTALAGGKRYFFATAESLAAFNESLAAFDDAPGPHAGAQVYLADDLDGGDGGFNWDAADEIVQNEADAWTENEKNVFFIRVEFSDATNSVTQAQLSTSINVASSNSIREMSYGKTWITATVSAATILLPLPSTGYLPDDNNLLHNNAIAAYEAINGVGSLSGYDIIGVHFPGIGMKSGSLTYGGLAGGSRQWLQGTYSSNTIIHEFGHNYGIGHASFWDISDGSVTGTGVSSEYGDPYDIMGGGPDPQGHFHMQAKQALNWIETPQWVDVNASGSGTYRIYRIDDDDTTGTLRGMRVTKVDSPSEYYWLGYRAAITNNTYLQNGAYLLWKRQGFSRSWLLDSTPDSLPNDREDCAIAIGRTFSDPVAGVHITPVQTGGSGANSWIEINAQIGTFPGNGAPTATLNVPATVAARTPVTISVSASDPNGDPLSYHWDLADGTLSPNSSSFSRQWTVGGTYSISVTVSDMKGGTVQKTVTVTVTDPLDAWTVGSVGGGLTVNDIAFLDGRFIATGNSSAYFSVDGVTWQSQLLNSNFRSGGVATDGTFFVIAGHNYNFDTSDWIADIYRSVDGRTWEKIIMSIRDELRDVTYANGVFVAVGDNGTILRSTNNGLTWAPQTTPGIAYLRSITYGDGVFVAVGQTAVYTSPNGITWTDRSSGHSMPSWQSLKDVTFQNGTFYAGGYRSDVQISIDGGVTWTRARMLDARDYDIESFAQTDGVIVATAYASSGAAGPVLLVSGDQGATWKESNYSGFSDSDSIAFGNGKFIAGHGSTGQTLTSNSFYPANKAPSASLNGPASATARTTGVYSALTNDTDGDPLLVLWDFGDGSPLVESVSTTHTFATGGTYTVTLTVSDKRGGIVTRTQSVTITDPLDTWTQRTSGTTSSLNDITYGADKLVAVGSGSGTYRVSTNGSTWTGGTIGTNISLKGIIHDGTQFIAVGQNYDFGILSWIGVIYTSPDAATWTPRLSSGEELNGVAYGDGVYIAVGDAGTAWRSTNGTTWTPVNTGATQNLNDVSFGSARFVIVGAAGNGGTNIVLKSADGLVWSNTSAGAGVASWQGFYTVQYLKDRFLANGWYTKIRHSTNAGTNFATTRTETELTPGFAYGNGVYLAAGIDQNSDADVNLISTNGANWAALTTSVQEDRNAAVFFNNTFITVGNAGSIWQSDAFTPPAPAPGFAAWQSAYFPGLPAGSAAVDDYDGDSISNLAEYATGTNPRNPVSRIPLTPEITGDFLYLTIPKAAGVSDITYAIELSTDLITWGPGTTGTVVVFDNASVLSVRSSATTSTAYHIFMRSVFTLTP